MNRSYRILPVYSGDVSGACSALFELGGMVVIHDPSGCNSTYNTHDETRWYDHDSLIFISGLTEIDAILGNDDKFIRDILDAADELKPKFIALCNSPIPFMNGTDFNAISKIIENKSGIPCFYIPTNGMHDYTVGAGSALRLIAERFVKPTIKNPNTLNILGFTPLDFGIKASREALISFAEDAGFSVISCWAMGDDLQGLSRAASASVDLVVSASGLSVAEYFYKCFDIPYVVGVPVGAFREILKNELQRISKAGGVGHSCSENRSSADGTWSIIGEPVTMGSVACALELETGHPVRVLCPLETGSNILNSSDLCTEGEEEAESALKSAKVVIGDALYKPICPVGSGFIELPHQAFSGRNSWKTACELVSLDVKSLLNI